MDLQRSGMQPGHTWQLCSALWGNELTRKMPATLIKLIKTLHVPVATSKGADRDKADSNDWTLSHHATFWRGRSRASDAINEYGADLNWRTNNGH